MFLITPVREALEIAEVRDGSGWLRKVDGFKSVPVPAGLPTPRLACEVTEIV